MPKPQRRLVGALLFAIASGCFALAQVAHAGERWLGNIIVTDAGTASNRTTGWTAYAGAGVFAIPAMGKISVQCDQDCLVGTDVSGCDAGNCVRLGANVLLPTSVGPAIPLTGKAFNSDAGTAGHVVTESAVWLSVSPWNTDGGGTTAVMHVYSRNGNE